MRDRTDDAVKAVPVFPDIARLSPEFTALYEDARPFTLTSVPLAFALYTAMRYVIEADVPGDVAECGVWRGGSALIAATCLQRAGDATRCLWLYDTFDWAWEPAGPQDGFLAASGDLDPSDESKDDLARQGASESDVVERLLQRLPRRRIRTVVGRVQDTLPVHGPHRLSLLRLDTDLYESTAHELEHLFPRLSPGGVLIVDDYGKLSGATQAVDDYFKRKGLRMLLTRIDAQGRIGVKL